MSTQVLNNVEIVHHDLRVWTGQKKLEASDLERVNKDDLPPEEVASLGLKRLIDANHLKIFSTIRHQADRASREVGVRFLGAYAVPQEAVADLMARLDQLRHQFDAEVQSFLALYDERVEEWADRNPGFRNQILRAKIPRDTVKARFNASFAVYRVVASQRDNGASMAAESAGLYDSLLDSVHGDLSEYVARCRTAACDGFRVVVRDSIRDLALKMRRFGFLDDSGGLVAFAAELEQAVVGTGKIRDGDYASLKAVLKDLTSVEAIKDRIAELASNGGVSSRVVHVQQSFPGTSPVSNAPAPLASPAREMREDPVFKDQDTLPKGEDQSASSEPDDDKGDALTLDSFSDAHRRPSLTSLNW